MTVREVKDAVARAGISVRITEPNDTPGGTP
jgi:hypothetical protein